MQIDTDNEANSFPEILGNGYESKNYEKLIYRFDILVIWMLRCFEGSLKLDKRFEIISIIVTDCKYHELVGNYVRKLNSTKLMLKLAC